MNTIRPAAFIAAINLCGFFPALALAEDIVPSSSETTLSFYGQINMGIQSYDDGVQSYQHFLVDNANNDNGSYLGFAATRALNSGWDVTGTFEVSLAPRPSDMVSQTDPDFDAYKFDQTAIRTLEISFANAQYGTFYLGQGEMSAAGSGPDFSGTQAIASRNPADTAGGHFWRFEDDTLSNRPLSAVLDDQNAGRRFRLRYDTASFHGITLSASVGREVLSSGDDNTYIDFVANYARSFGDFDVELEFDATGTGDEDYALIGAAAVLHRPSGLNMTMSGSHSTNGPHYGYAKIGIIRDLFSFGATAISLDHYNSGRFVIDESEGLSWGVSLVQHVDQANMEIYAAWRSYDAYNNLGIANEQFLPSEAISAGILWQF